MQDPITVLIVDDQMLVREGLRELMKYWNEYKIVGEASNGKEAIEMCQRLHPDMVLMDAQMPIMSGVEAVGEITKRFADIDVIMLTVALDDDTLMGAIRNGAKGYVLKDMPSKELRERLAGVAKGEFPISGLVAARLVGKMDADAVRNVDNTEARRMAEAISKFTPREVEILRLVAEGYSNIEIGAKLYLGAGTVKKHLSSIMQKLELDNRVQVATFAYRSGIMDEDSKQ